MSIAYYKYNEINKDKWDRCVRESYNGLIYSTSLYLDHMAGQWDALVFNNYEAVMPLPWRKKWGIQYVYPPAFTQQLGVSSLVTETTGIIGEFLNAIPAKFRYVEMNFNATNLLDDQNFIGRKNYILSLQGNHDQLTQAFSRSAKRNILKANKCGIHVEENTRAESIIELHRNRFKDNIGVSARDYERFNALVTELLLIKKCYCIGARDNAGNLIAGSIYTIFKNRITFIINGNTPESLENGATHLLMDFTIKKFCNASFILDFEGSDQPSFTRFYEQYGARAETYFFLRQNKLPFPLNLLKPGIHPAHI